MHKIYETEGSFNFIYQLPQILYSSLISIVINTLVKTLSVSEYQIINFKKIRNIKIVQKFRRKLENKLQIKFILFFIITFIFNLFFGYYLACCCAIYRNTQIHLIKDTIISYGLSLLYPFVLCLIPGIIRIPSLANENTNRSLVYQLSKLIQFLL